MHKFFPRICIVSLVSFFFVQANAQSVPTELRSMFPKKNAHGRSVVSINSLTAIQNQAQMKGTRFHPGGYLEVEVSQEYVNMLSTLKIDSHFSKAIIDSNLTIGGSLYLGMMDEGTNKKSFTFGGTDSRQLFVTAWRYAADGTSMTITKEFINQKVHKLDGTLSLAYAPLYSKCMWKLFVSDDNLSFEIMISDTMVNGAPSLPVKKVMALADELITFSNARL